MTVLSKWYVICILELFFGELNEYLYTFKAEQNTSNINTSILFSKAEYKGSAYQTEKQFSIGGM